MTSIEQIKTEIKKRIKELSEAEIDYREEGCDSISALLVSGISELQKILSFISTIELDKSMEQDEELNDKKWTSSKVAKPEKTGLYLITDGIHWRVLLVNNGEVMRYEDWDDGYTTDKDYLNIEWWWRPLPNLPNGTTPYYYE